MVETTQSPARKPKPPTYLGGKRSYLGTGRRKTAVARVILTDGTGQISINGRSLEGYFTEDKDRAAVLGPLEVTEMRNRVDVRVTVRGGGFTGQAGAVCQGIARALKTMFGLTPAPQQPAAEQKPTELGGKVMVAPFDAPWVRMTLLSDPQGATFIASQFVPENRDSPRGA